MLWTVDWMEQGNGEDNLRKKQLLMGIIGSKTCEEILGNMRIHVMSVIYQTDTTL